MSKNKINIQPAFNMPQVIVSLSALMLAIHAARVFILDDPANLKLLVMFSFIPARYLNGIDLGDGLPGGLGAEIWSPLTYGLLHGDWVHLGVNLAWLIAFGSPVAERLGTWRFLVLGAVTTVAGAFTHFAFNSHQVGPLIGASAGISGVVAASTRFVFSGPNSPRGRFRGAIRLPAPTLTDLLKNTQVLGFIGLWLGLNLLVGLIPGLVGAGNMDIAWQAHAGGFVLGFFLFQLLDPIPRGKKSGDDVPPSQNPPAA